MTNSAPEEHYRELKAKAQELGISLFGVADLDPVRETFHESIREKAQGMRYGISLGFLLSEAIVEAIVDRPTLVYKQHYKSANYLLDQAALRMTTLVQEKGFQALPIGASQMVDWEKQRGHLSHKVVARQAGLGFFGRSSLLVNPEHGARFRLTTVLTNLALPADNPKQGDCGDCTLCIGACPAGAISLERYDLGRCLAKLKEFAKAPGIGVHICGVCVKACPTKAISQGNA